MRIEIDVFGDQQASRDLLRFGDRAVDARPVFVEMLSTLASIEARQFDSEGARSSGGWAPLAASTVAEKARRGADLRILRASGDLLASLTDAAGGDAIREASEHEMRFGTSVPYAEYHQKGTSRMPRRRPLELTEHDRADLVRDLQAYIVGGAA